MIGASAEAIATAEDRERFKVAMTDIGLAVPASGFAYTLEEAMEVGATHRVSADHPTFGTSWAGPALGSPADGADLARLTATGLAASPISEILIERSIAGWKEYELEVMRDRADNCVVVCSIENFDPMGVHTGDSITVAPAQTLSDEEYQRMRDDAFKCIRRIGVETGGSNIQFAVNPATGDQVVIEMNPRVSRSSAWRRRRPAFLIAKIAARLAVGYTLDEIANDITRKTPASFEPTIDYVVTKVPRWAFEKFPGTPEILGTRMQSVGEAMRHRLHVYRVAAEGTCARSNGAASASTAIRPRGSTTSGTTTSWCAEPPSPPRTGRSSSKRRSVGASRPSASTKRPAWIPGSWTRSNWWSPSEPGLAEPHRPLRAS